MTQHFKPARIDRVGKKIQKSTDSAYDFFFSDDIRDWFTSKKRTYARAYVDQAREIMRKKREAWKKDD